ncbi:hypothetical protein C5167_004513 [Papaver somniferum]|uniref:Uncharacterized protein n=1 Tax=Papaver somniferum TaxID=3469 RepID=A0A4Y7JB95_PAPSO|nr:hypothetical protein C5167_004512 [Papaver somniferum]RZC57211.1 hypothetical protein C5167_004513 [Papaver somniferum]
MEHRDSLILLLANGLTIIILIAILVGNILWRKWHKEGDHVKKRFGDKMLKTKPRRVMAPDSWADAIHVDLSLIVEELDSLCQVISSLEDIVQALESREDIRFSGILSSLQFINANSEQMANGRKISF